MYIKGTGILHHNCEISILAEDWCQLLCHQLLRHDSVKTKDGPSRGNCKKARAEKQRRNRLEASGNSNWQGASWNDFCLVILSSYMLVDGMDEIHLSSWGSKKKMEGYIIACQLLAQLSEPSFSVRLVDPSSAGQVTRFEYCSSWRDGDPPACVGSKPSLQVINQQKCLVHVPEIGIQIRQYQLLDF